MSLLNNLPFKFFRFLFNFSRTCSKTFSELLFFTRNAAAGRSRWSSSALTSSIAYNNTILFITYRSRIETLLLNTNGWLWTKIRSDRSFDSWNYFIWIMKWFQKEQIVSSSLKDFLLGIKADSVVELRDAKLLVRDLDGFGVHHWLDFW